MKKSNQPVGDSRTASLIEYPEIISSPTSFSEDGVSVQTVAVLGRSKSSMMEKQVSRWIKRRQENRETEVVKS
jgi:hypothetical protein